MVKPTNRPGASPGAAGAGPGADGRAAGAPQAQLANAQHAAKAAQHAVASNSARRLTELTALPPGKRVQHLNDPSLEPADRERLRDGLGSVLRKARSPKARSRLPSRIAAFVGSRRSWSSVAVFLLLAIAATGFGIAWWRTGERWAVVTMPVVVTLTTPNGTVQQFQIPAGTWFVIERTTKGTATVRLWQDNVGYYRGNLPVKVLR
jgi:hypothetical protein